MSKNKYDPLLGIPKNKKTSELVQNISQLTSDMEGKLLTIIDSSITNENQLHAIKSLIRQVAWENFRFVASLVEKGQII